MIKIYKNLRTVAKFTKRCNYKLISYILAFFKMLHAKDHILSLMDGGWGGFHPLPKKIVSMLAITRR